MKNLSYESWIRQFVENLSEYFDLAGWTIKIDFSEDEDDGKKGTYADNCINSQYLHSLITFYRQCRLDYESAELDNLITAVVHELVHIFLDPFQDYMHPHLSITTTPLFMNTLEQQTQKLTMVFLKTLPPNIIPPRPNGKHDSTSSNHRKKPADDKTGSADVRGKHV